METNSREQILSSCNELDRLLIGARPEVDDARLGRIASLCANLEGDSRIREKANRLAKRASIFFNARRHLTYHGGASAVMHEMRFSLLQEILEQIAAEARCEGIRDVAARGSIVERKGRSSQLEPCVQQPVVKRRFGRVVVSDVLLGRSEVVAEREAPSRD